MMDFMVPSSPLVSGLLAFCYAGALWLTCRCVRPWRRGGAC